MWDQPLPPKSPQPVLGLRTAAPCTSRLTVCKCQAGANNFLYTAGEERCWGDRRREGARKRKGQGRPGHGKREREEATRRGVGTRRQPPQERPSSIASRPSWCDGVAHLWPPPPAAPAAAAAALGVRSYCPEPRCRQGDLPGHASDAPLWTSAILPNPAI